MAAATTTPGRAVEGTPFVIRPSGDRFAIYEAERLRATCRTEPSAMALAAWLTPLVTEPEADLDERCDSCGHPAWMECSCCCCPWGGDEDL